MDFGNCVCVSVCVCVLGWRSKRVRLLNTPICSYAEALPGQLATVLCRCTVAQLVPYTYRRQIII